MRLEVALVDGLGLELALNHVVGFREAFIRIPEHVLEMVRDVAMLVRLLTERLGLHLLVQQGRSILGRGHDVDHGRQHLVFDLD